MDPGTSETRLGSPLSHAAAVGGFAPGTVLAERYRIVALVGHGGMGEVYRADDLRLGQPVALKFLPVALEHDSTARDRLFDEVRSARTVSHPNVCRVYDVGEVEGRYFFTMEYIDGEDLASLLRRIGRLPAAKALEIARELCAGLAAAHERGVLHRDLKPANVMIDGRGHARITDFGLAVRLADEREPARPRQAVGAARGVVEVAGTIAYLAPERFEGKPATAQSDLYALGLVLYEVYTGKQALSAATIEDWRRAHSDSTPSRPSTIVVDIEPAVERAILRCLEKDPAKRPASAAQLAAALPGGDPLAAAIAAGETPSPELVAASGEEGTLPRKQAWLWFSACVLALAVAVPLGSLWHIENLVSIKDPTVLRETAREILRDAGYSSAPADSSWRLRVDSGAMPPLLVFCYRQAPMPLFDWSPFGDVTSSEPAPLDEEDAYVELDPNGRLLSLRVGGLAARYEQAASRVPETDWRRLFAAAGLDYGRFTPQSPAWPSVFAFDRNVAWEGMSAERAYRVEAAAFRGRPVQFRVGPTAAPPVAASRTAGSSSDDRQRWLLDLLVAIVILGTIGAASLVAVHNVRAGRGDRRGAMRVALAILAAQAIFFISCRHWTFDPINILRVVTTGLGGAFFAGAAVWLYYLAVEPFGRRRWPQMLIAWARLLNGGWRDPLVGRSLLAGVAGGLVAGAILPGVATIVMRLTNLPLAFTWSRSELDMGIVAPFLTNRQSWFVGPADALCYVAVLLVAGALSRSTRVAWAILVAADFGIILWMIALGQPAALVAPLGPITITALVATTNVVVLARHGLLASAVQMSVFNAVLNTPLTPDLTRWYAWRTGVIVVVLFALAFWGFKNVLGRQTAFPAGTLDG